MQAGLVNVTLADAGITSVAAECGGCMNCATCHVNVDAGWLVRLAPPSADEQATLERIAAPRQPESRLCCQIVLRAALDGLVVRLPETPY